MLAAARPSVSRSPLPGNTCANAAPDSPRWPAAPLSPPPARRPSGARSAVLEQLSPPPTPPSARTRPPATVPPSTNATVAVPGGRALVAVHPRGAAELGHHSTAVCRHAGPNGRLSAPRTGVELAQWLLKPGHLRHVGIPAGSPPSRRMRGPSAAASRPSGRLGPAPGTHTCRGRRRPLACVGGHHLLAKPVREPLGDPGAGPAVVAIDLGDARVEVGAPGSRNHVAPSLPPTPSRATAAARSRPPPAPAPRADGALVVSRRRRQRGHRTVQPAPLGQPVVAPLSR